MKFKDEVLILTFEEYAKANRPSMRLDRSELKGKKAPTYHYATTEKAFVYFRDGFRVAETMWSTYDPTKFPGLLEGPPA